MRGPFRPLACPLLPVCLLFACGALVPEGLTEKTSVASVVPEETLRGERSCMVRFSVPMDRASVERNTLLLHGAGADAKPVRLEFRWHNAFTAELEFPCPLPPGPCELAISAGAESASGTDLSPPFRRLFEDGGETAEQGLPSPLLVELLSEGTATAAAPSPACGRGFDRSSLLRVAFPRSLTEEERELFGTLLYTEPDLFPVCSWNTEGGLCTVSFPGEVPWNGYCRILLPPGPVCFIFRADGENSRPPVWESLEINGAVVHQGDPFPAAETPVQEIRCIFTHSANGSLPHQDLLEAVSFSVSGGESRFLFESALSGSPEPGVTSLLYRARLIPGSGEGILTAAVGGWLEDTLGNRISGSGTMELCLAPGAP